MNMPIKKLIKVLPVLALLVLGAGPAQTCSYVQRSFKILFEEAPVVFIGNVVTVKGKRVVFQVAKEIKGLEGRRRFEIQKGSSSCDIKYSPGSLWLYMGEQIEQGSVLLIDEYGRAFDDNIAFVKEQFHFDPSDSPAFFPAVAVDACSPWDGAAFFIRLKNGWTANVYTSLDNFVGNEGVVRFETGYEGKNGSVIFKCDENGKNCGPREHGSITIVNVTEDSVSGVLEIEDVGVGVFQRYQFKAERHPNTAPCG